MTALDRRSSDPQRGKCIYPIFYRGVTRPDIREMYIRIGALKIKSTLRWKIDPITRAQFNNYEKFGKPKECLGDFEYAFGAPKTNTNEIIPILLG